MNVLTCLAIDINIIRFRKSNSVVTAENRLRLVWSIATLVLDFRIFVPKQ
jgi:hypothetical protein